MPLPDYGHMNKEKKTHQDLVFEMAPEIVSDEETEMLNGKRVHVRRGKVTTGKIGIDLERKLVINNDSDPNIWRTEVDPRDIEDAKKYSNPNRKVLKDDVRKTLDSLISGSKLNSIKSVRRPSVADQPPPSAEYNKNVRFSLPANNRQSEESVTGVSIQPSGTYRIGDGGPRNSPARSSISPGRVSPSKPGARGSTPPSVGQRVDPRYQGIQPRQTLTQAYHAKAVVSRGPTGVSAPRVGGEAVGGAGGIGGASSGYSYSQVSQTRTFSAHGIRGLN
ncbi:uncharacterized protein LOC111716483 isoform X2 [Eurytemora carolleeae]|uniref:uncharacterized protein LOC111716483 isoform X1 n=1 Tax=Eurytemora carolleeae TaxID=1294199 RepID=UPI000C7622A5|nr:uncharacterized protein LOC111716483 isoform X1 [Eurytemora carolleeae]XP_023347725.1 uncharacterized protein LOC111716483 isoform X2 [Eurytemora carolleeae]|eukprot:XP_023347724.1 uncharacterized protein LOC111716483 isoform X1 [Eurytemora affinis]